MKKTTILLAIVCSMFVGLSMAVTFHILNGGRSSSTAQGNAAGAATHDMPPGMSHEEHLKIMAEAAAKQPAGGQQASAGDKSMDHSSMPPGADHDMPAGMSHEDHLKMMAAQQSAGQASAGDKSKDHSMPSGADHNMPAGMSHEDHLKMMAAQQPTGGQKASANDKPMDHSNMPSGMDHDMPAGMSHEDHLKMMAEAEAKKQAASVGDKPMSHDHHPGQEDSSDPRPQFRSIKSLTADEIKAYEEGTGHGMAKAAEQNHYPGPRHVLDLSKELKLSAEQVREIQKIKESMSAAAIAAGKQLIENERKLNLLFADKKIDQNQLAAAVGESSALQSKLRLIHLSAHLQTQKILSQAQIDKYDELRGYKNAKNIAADSHHDHSM